MVGDEDDFVQGIFVGLFQSSVAAAGGDRAAAFPLAAERAAPERMENPQPVALSSWRRAVSDRLFVIVRDTDHFTVAEDFARLFPWPEFERGSLPFAPDPRTPTGSPREKRSSARRRRRRGDPYTQLGWARPARLARSISPMSFATGMRGPGSTCG